MELEKTDLVIVTGCVIAIYFLYKELMKGTRSAYNYIPEKSIAAGVRG